MPTCDKCGLIFLPLEWHGWEEGWIFTGKCPKCGERFTDAQNIEEWRQQNEGGGEK